MAACSWQPGQPAQDEFRRIACAEIDRGLEVLGDEDRHRAVHTVRQRGKKVRALLRLVRDAAPQLYRRENAAFRDTMRRISEDRDAGVAVETYDALLSRFSEDGMAEELAPIRSVLAERRQEVLGEDLEARLEGIRAELVAARERVEGWELEGAGFAVFEGGVARTYRRARARMHAAYDEGTSSAFHLWRKRAKYHRQHLRLLEAAWPEVVEPHRQQVHALTDLLGDDHDLAVLRADLTAAPARFAGARRVAALCGLLDRRRAELQAAAHALGQRCFAEEEGCIVARLGSYWDVATAGAEAGPLSDPAVAPGR